MHLGEVSQGCSGTQLLLGGMQRRNTKTRAGGGGVAVCGVREGCAQATDGSVFTVYANISVAMYNQPRGLHKAPSPPVPSVRAAKCSIVCEGLVAQLQHLLLSIAC